MTRKDYLLLSTAVRAARITVARIEPAALTGVDVTASTLASTLKEQSNAFDVRRFLVDCGTLPPVVGEVSAGEVAP